MKEETFKGWAAKDKGYDYPCVYKNRPKRTTSGSWYDGSGDLIILRKDSLPDLKWEDEPIEVEITIKRK